MGATITIEKKRWTEEEVEKLKQLIKNGIENKDIAEELGRTESAVKCKTREIYPYRAEAERKKITEYAEKYKAMKVKFLVGKRYWIDNKQYELVKKYPSFMLFKSKNGYMECFTMKDLVIEKEVEERRKSK